MLLIELEKPQTEPVSVAEAKAWARIERGDEDGVIARLIAAARESVERRTGLVLGPRPFRLVAEALPRDGRLHVPRRPILHVTGVRTFDAEGAETMRELSTVAVRGEALVLAPALSTATCVEIEFEAGEAAAPEAVRQAILRIVASSYETRGLVDEAMQPAIVPAFAAALLAPFRRVAL